MIRTTTTTTTSKEARPRRPETPLTDSSNNPSAVASRGRSPAGGAAPNGPSATSPPHGPNPELTPDPSPLHSPVGTLYAPVPRRVPQRVRYESPDRAASASIAPPSGASTPQLWMPKPKRGHNDGWLSRDTSHENLVRQGYLSAYPNSAPRYGGVSHFDLDGSTPSLSSTPFRSGANSPALIETVRARQRHVPTPRRRSDYVSAEWLCSEMGHEEEEKEEGDLEKKAHVGSPTDDDANPSDSRGSSAFLPGACSIDGVGSDSELDGMELELPEDALWTTTKRRWSAASTPSPFQSRDMARCGAATSLLPGPDMMAAAAAAVPGNAPLKMRPRGAAHVPLHRRHQTIGRDDYDEHLAGQGIVYTRCRSPETVHLETDQLYRKVCELEQSCRDKSGKSGLWGGYCVGLDGRMGGCAAIRGPKMISTPRPDAVPGVGPFALPFPKCGASGGASWSPIITTPSSCSAPSSHNNDAEEAALGQKIRDEFTDHFVTQVYNYLSLGYPAIARSYDQEMAKITGVPVAALCRDDDELMANGHFVDEVDPEDEDDDLTGGEDRLPRPRGAEKPGAQRERCPRWKALRAYVHEWARQHPNLDTLDPLVWGLQERRGSWAV